MKLKHFPGAMESGFFKVTLLISNLIGIIRTEYFIHKDEVSVNAS